MVALITSAYSLEHHKARQQNSCDSAVRVYTDSVFTNVVVVRLITLTSVSVIHFLVGVYNMEAVLVSHFKLLTFSDISEI